MAIADVTNYSGGETKSVVLLASTTATNSPPSGSSAGLSVSEILNLFNFMPQEVTLMLYSTAGSGTMTVTARLWGYTPVNGGMWIPLGAGGDSTKGVINAGAAIGETGTDTIRHAETIALPGHFQRLYLEITDIGGTSTAVTAEIVVRRGYAS